MNVADFDQVASASNDIAGMMRLYYNALIKQGFTEEQSLILVGQYQTALVSTMFIK